MKRTAIPNCKCRDDVSEDLKALFETARPTIVAYQALFHELLTEIATLRVADEDDDEEEGAVYANSVCRLHMYLPLQRVGYIVRNLKNEELIERMEEFANHEDPVTMYRQKPDCYRFAERVRAPRRIQQRGGWKYEAKVKEPDDFQFDQKAVLEGHFPGAFDAFEKNGVTNNEIFDWIFDLEYGENGKSLAAILLEELDVYAWHFSRRASESDLGWLRNCFHSLIQQLIRQDLLYYVTYCCLRPDKATTLISYPYYVKKTVEGSKTHFHHMDINPRKLRDGTGHAMIQGFVSLTDEYEDHCTEMVLGMHKWGPDWWDKVVEEGRDQKSRGTVVDVDRRGLVTESDKTEFNFYYTRIPNKRGGATIFHPGLAHGSPGPAPRERILVLPWFVRASDNGMLEVPESGTWNDLASSHRDLSHAPNTPSGFPNMYGSTKTVFPASIQLLLDEPISNALVGRLAWSSTAVQEQRELLLDPTRVEEAKELINNSRKAASVRALAAFKQMVARERKVFGDNSYFKCVEEGIEPPPADDPDPTTEEEDDEDVEHDEDVEMIDHVGNEFNEELFRGEQPSVGY